MLKFFHHLLNPHCRECEHDKECKSCEMLQLQLDSANYERKQLLNTILELTNPKAEQSAPQIEQKIVQPKSIPWRVRQQMLETESRQAAGILRRQAEDVKEAMKASSTPTEELERELGINLKGEGLVQEENSFTKVG